MVVIPERNFAKTIPKKVFPKTEVPRIAWAFDNFGQMHNPA
jgi:hypothetical protein